MNWKFLFGVATGFSVGTAAWWLHFSHIRNRLKLLEESDAFFFAPHQIGEACGRKKLCEALACPLCNLKRYVLLISSAKTHLDVCVFLITSDELIRALVNLSNNGIFVRIIVDKTMIDEVDNSRLCVFLKENIPIKVVDQAEMMHNKFAIIDQKILVTGSFNWSRQGPFVNFENCVFVYNQKVVEKYLQYFQDIWLLAEKKEALPKA